MVLPSTQGSGAAPPESASPILLSPHRAVRMDCGITDVVAELLSWPKGQWWIRESVRRQRAETAARKAAEADLSPLSMLPDELIMYTLSFLEPEHLMALRLTSRDAYRLVADEQLWQYFCKRDWPFLCPAAPLRSSWLNTYKTISRLSGSGWRGTSQWLKPEGYDYCQHTRLEMAIEKRTGVMRGCGATQNNKKLMTFDLEGQMAPGGVFRWKKTFSYHTTLYTGKLNIELGTLTGTLDYQDQTTAWEGVFRFKPDPNAWRK
eukprot:TRINITY_DN1951_c0_g1_i6.p1 TRINITY_DN1951_c0_g1~~TRINITY_DN1951_c0_g1_i6.p1  ORF type:complete len:262 (+),score=46.22 TRINITY_DN1951_c0_g1_i6:78-863(+)